MTAHTPARLPFRLALATVLCAVPLVLFGSSVTTLGAGMAVEGWLIAEGHFLVLFPIEKWFRDVGTMVEHSHRLFGTLVGVLAILTVVTTFLRDGRGRAKVLALVALLAVAGQGTLGGFRVLENSPHLAYLHGVAAHLVFAILIATAAYLSPSWQLSAQAPSSVPAGLRRLATACVLGVFGQVVLGAWYRHALRDDATPHVGRFMAHLLGAFLLVGLLLALTLFLKRMGSPSAMRARRGVVHLLGAQFVLGILAYLGFKAGSVGPIEWTMSIAHVLCGSLLLADVVVIRMWAARGSSVAAHDAAETPAKGEVGA